MLIPGPGNPMTAGPVAPSPQQGGLDPAALIDGMLKLATVYRDTETHAVDRLKMEKVTTLLQQILADQHTARQQSRPMFGTGPGFGGVGQ